jgi:hypothetical protein
MNALTLAIHRPWTEQFEDVEGRLQLHKARARMLHAMAEELDLKVMDWGETDSTYPREFVEIVVAVSSQLIAETISTYIKRWWSNRQVRNVEVVNPSGQRFGLTDLTPDEIDDLESLIWKSRAMDFHSGQ